MTDTKTALKVLFGNNTTKATILEALTEKPLTLKELHYEIQKNNPNPTTYQATHKATQEMINDEILTKQGKQIKINKEWIEKIYSFSSQLKLSKEDSINKEEGKVKTYVFDTFVEAGKFIIQVTLETPTENKPGIAVFHHAWPFVGMSKVDFEKLQQIGKKPFYDIIVHDTPLDKTFAKILSDVGKTVKTGISVKMQFDVLVQGNRVFQIYFTKEFTKKYYEIFDKYKKLEMLSVGELMEKMLIQKTKITIIEIENAEISDKIREEILKEFGIKY